MRILQVQLAQVKSGFNDLKLKSSKELSPTLSETVTTTNQSKSEKFYGRAEDK
jgi:hypothetical protein